MEIKDLPAGRTLKAHRAISDALYSGTSVQETIVHIGPFSVHAKVVSAFPVPAKALAVLKIDRSYLYHDPFPMPNKPLCPDSCYEQFQVIGLAYLTPVNNTLVRLSKPITSGGVWCKSKIFLKE